MNLSTANFKDPFARQEAVALFRQFCGYDPVKGDQVIEEYAKRPGCVAVEARSNQGVFMGFGMATLAVDTDPWQLAVYCCAPRDYKGAWVIVEIHVVEAVRRTGIASAILDQIEASGPRGWAILGVDYGNIAAQKLYAKRGWTDTRISFIPKGFSRQQWLYEKYLNPPSP